ncbi:MAG TPA: TfoX/Sxy family protein [Caulobacteraceae bacterium]
MAASQSFTEHVRELLGPLGPIRIKRMFGGTGVWCDDRMFAFIEGDDLYLKADAESRPLFEAAGSEPFMIEMKGRTESTGYWRLPAGASDDAAEALRWARLGLDAALRARKPKKKGASVPAAAALGPGPWDAD